MSRALGVPRATYYRARRPRPVRPRRLPARALSGTERATVHATLLAPRFVDLGPAQVYATLLDDGQYLCAERTMYRILAAHAEVGERCNQLRHPAYTAPELLATRPNERWSWDITKLYGLSTVTQFSPPVVIEISPPRG